MMTGWHSHDKESNSTGRFSQQLKLFGVPPLDQRKGKQRRELLIALGVYALPFGVLIDGTVDFVVLIAVSLSIGFLFSNNS